MIEYKINENDAGQRLDRYLSKAFPSISSSLRYKLIRKKRIKLNKKRCSPNDRLFAGDTITLYLSPTLLEPAKKSTLLSFLPIDVVYEDENILILNKPCGLKSQPDSKGDDSAISRLISYLISKGEYRPETERSFTPALCNRLDRNTDGLLIAAKNAAALRILNKKIKNREIEKWYICIVEGRPKEDHAILKGWWTKNSKQNIATISSVASPGFKEIITEYWVKNVMLDTSLLEISLHTGRSHQIRAHMASIGNPLAGDKKYGGTGTIPFKLTAYKLTFNFKTDAGVLNYLNQKTFSIKN